MEMLVYLIPVSLILGGAGLGAFLWALRSRQFEDPEGDGQRILGTDWDDRPKPAAPDPAQPDLPATNAARRD